MAVNEKLNTGLVTFIVSASCTDTIAEPGLYLGLTGMNRFRAFTTASGSDEIVPTTDNTGCILGVLQEATPNGQSGQCLLIGNGISRVEAGETLTPGLVGADSVGRAVAGSGLGMCLDSAAVGELVRVVLGAQPNVDS